MFGCEWQLEGNATCGRVVIMSPGLMCRWHVAAKHIENFLSLLGGPAEVESDVSWRRLAVLSFVFPVLIFFQRVLVILTTGNISYWLSLLISFGLLLISIGLVVSWARVSIPASRLDNYCWVTIPIFWGGSLLIATLHADQSGFLLRVQEGLLTYPFVFMAYQFERRSSAMIGVLLVTMGIVSILLILPIFLALETAYHAKLIGEYLELVPDKRGWGISFAIGVNLLPYLAVAADALVAVYKTGRMLTPFRPSVLIPVSLLIIVGQSRLFGEFILAWTDINLFTSWSGFILSVSAVLAIHWGFFKLQSTSPEHEDE